MCKKTLLSYNKSGRMTVVFEMLHKLIKVWKTGC